MDKKETGVNSKMGEVRIKSADLHMRTDESGKGTVIPEPDSQKSDVKTTSKEGMIAKILDVGLSIVQEWISGTAVVR